MNRFTSKSPTRYNGKTSKAWKKLQRLENLEEELGCPLEVVFNALVNGVYCDDRKRNYYSGTELSISGTHKALMVYEINVCWVTKNGIKSKKERVEYARFEFSDYKKTWWLKENKSE